MGVLKNVYGKVLVFVYVVVWRESRVLIGVVSFRDWRGY